MTKMKKIIAINLFIILLTGVFLFGKNNKDRHSVLMETADMQDYGKKVLEANRVTMAKVNRELKAKVANYQENVNYTLHLKKENQQLKHKVVKLEKENYRLLSYIGAQKNLMKKMENPQIKELDKKVANMKKQELAKAQYDHLKYKNKMVHSNTVTKKTEQYFQNQDQQKRAPASHPAPEETAENYEIRTSLEHTIQKGEDLMQVSKIYYNTHKKWTLIVKANPEIDFNKLEVGQVVIVPNIEDEVVLWIDGKMVLKKDYNVDSERKPATIKPPEVDNY